MIKLKNDLVMKGSLRTSALRSLQAAFFCIILCLPFENVLGSDVEIVGSAKFTDQIVNALALLKSKAPEEYAIVVTYVKRIEQGEHSGMWAYKTPPTYEMNDKTTFYSLTWCAATIAHDTCHSKLYHDFKATHEGSQVPVAIWTGTDAEKQCMKYQLKVMSLIDSPKNEFDYSKLQADGHYAGDNGSWNEYQHRSW
jgi:hypothetical protein